MTVSLWLPGNPEGAKKCRGGWLRSMLMQSQEHATRRIIERVAMGIQPMRFPHFPRNDEDWEDLCVRVFRCELSIPGLARFGRPGQPQGGIDLIGNDSGGSSVSVQCRLKLSGTLSEAEITEVVEQTAQHHPSLARLIIATTGRRDSKAQKHALAIDAANKRKGKFGVDIWFWEDFEDFFGREPSVAAEIFDGVLPGSTAQRILRGVEQIQTAMVAAVPSDSPPTDTDKQIDEAFAHTKRGQPDRTIALLVHLQERSWDKLSDKLRYRTLANIGTAYFAKGALERAAEFFLNARNFQDSPAARCLEARALVYQNKFDEAGRVIDEVIRAHPNHAQAYALRVNLEEQPYETALSRIPLPYRDNAEVALALSFLATVQRRFKEAETHARDATVAEPNWTVAQTHLATVLLLQAKAGGVTTPDGKIALQDLGGLAEAETLLSKVAEDSTSNDYARGMALVNRSSVRRLVGREAEARDDLDHALRLLPNDRGVVSMYAANLEATGNREEATRQWRRAAELDGRGIAPELVLAGAALDQGPEAIASGVRELEGLRQEAAECRPEEKFEFVRILSLLRHAANASAYSVQSPPHRDLSDLLTPVGRAVLDAWWLCEFGDRTGARSAISALTDGALRRLSEPEIVPCGQLCLRLKELDLAMRCLRSHARPTQWTTLTAMYVDAAYRAGRWDEVLRWCESLRKAGVIRRELIALECQIRVNHEDGATTLSVLRDWLESHPDDEEAWLWLGLAGGSCGDQVTSEEVVTRIVGRVTFAPEEIDSALQLVVKSRSLSQGDKLSFVFRLWRQHRADHRAWRGLLAVFMTATSPGETPPTPEAVAVGTTALLRIEGEHKALMVSIEIGPDPDVKWSEYAPNSQMAVAIIGAKVGETRQVPGQFFVRTATVEQVVPTPHYVASRCLDEWDTTFPDIPFVQKFGAGDMPPHPTPEQLRAAFQPVARAVDELRRHAEVAVAKFKSELVTFWNLSLRLGRDHVEVVESVLFSDSLEFPCIITGSSEDESPHLKSLSQGVVVDASAITVMTHLELMDEFTKAIPVVMPSRLLVELEYMVGERRQPQDTLTEARGVPVIMQHDPKAHDLWHRRWTNAVVALRERANLTSGLPLLALDPQDRDSLQSTIAGPSGARAVAIAKANKMPLHMDDGRLAAIAGAIFGVTRVSSYSIIRYLHTVGRISESAFFDAHAKLIGWRMASLPFHPAAALASFRLAGWDMNKWPARQAIEVIGLPGNAPAAIARVLLTTLKQFWRSTPPGVDPAKILTALLHELDKRADGRAIGAAALTLVNQVFSIDVIAARDVETVIRMWLSTDPPLTALGSLIIT